MAESTDLDRQIEGLKTNKIQENNNQRFNSPVTVCGGVNSHVYEIEDSLTVERHAPNPHHFYIDAIIDGEFCSAEIVHSSSTPITFDETIFNFDEDLFLTSNALTQKTQSIQKVDQIRTVDREEECFLKTMTEYKELFESLYGRLFYYKKRKDKYLINRPVVDITLDQDILRLNTLVGGLMPRVAKWLWKKGLRFCDNHDDLIDMYVYVTS